eukprot:4979947-Alexandrium_andersonii.AAC.1
MQPPPPPESEKSLINQALWRIPTPCLPMVAIPEDKELWKNLDVSSAGLMEDWFRVVPPMWSCSPNHPI